MLNPVNHTKQVDGVRRYKGEPYVMAGDVYTEEPHQGRAGWSWYTGSCGWLYSSGIEHILGLKVRADHFTILPCVPRAWEFFSLTYKHNNVVYLIDVENPSKVESGVLRIEVDGQPLQDQKVIFENYKDQSEVKITVIMSNNSSPISIESETTPSTDSLN